MFGKVTKIQRLNTKLQPKSILEMEVKEYLQFNANKYKAMNRMLAGKIVRG